MKRRGLLNGRAGLDTCYQISRQMTVIHCLSTPTTSMTCQAGVLPRRRPFHSVKVPPLWLPPLVASFLEDTAGALRRMRRM